MKQALIPLLLFMAFNLQAQIIDPNSDVGNDCGPKIKKSKVMVLDIESFGEDREAAEAFIREHASDHQIVSETPEEILTNLLVFGTPTRYTAVKAARRRAAKRGCDLVIVLEAWTYKIGDIVTGTARSSSSTSGSFSGRAYGDYDDRYYNGSHDSRTNSSSSATVNRTDRRRGVATVLMGDRS